MKVAVCGIGKAGQSAINMINNCRDIELELVINREESQSIGKNVGRYMGQKDSGAYVYSIKNCKEELSNKKIDVIIDFSNRELTKELLVLCEELSVNLVICTTDFSEEEEKEILEVGKRKKIGVVYAPNLTIGINLLMDFTKKVSRVLHGFNYEIIEYHRKEKRIPSTTAQKISETIEGKNVPIHSIRAGNYTGVHEVVIANENESIKIKHESLNRGAFANGAILAARFVLNKKGFYKMSDVIMGLE